MDESHAFDNSFLGPAQLWGVFVINPVVLARSQGFHEIRRILRQEFPSSINTCCELLARGVCGNSTLSWPSGQD